MWWTPDKGMLHLHGQLPDVMGATFEATIQKLTEQMKPAKGQAWDSFEHRAADALVGLCEQPDTKDETPTLAPRPVVQVHVPEHGPAEIAGDPDRRLAARAAAGQREHRTGAGRRRRRPGRDRETLHVRCHPRSCGRCCCATGRAAAAALRRRHGLADPPPPPRVLGWHRRPLQPGRGVQHPPPGCSSPTAPWALVGNPNQPDGLRPVHLDDLTPEQRQQLGLPPRRAGPHAA